MLRQVLEAHEVGVLGSNSFTVNEDVMLVVHELLEGLDAQRTSHAYKQLRIFHIRVEFVEQVSLGAV